MGNQYDYLKRPDPVASHENSESSKEEIDELPKSRSSDKATGLIPQGIQKKLEIGSTDDPLEAEADLAADQVSKNLQPGSIKQRNTSDVQNTSLPQQDGKLEEAGDEASSLLMSVPGFSMPDHLRSQMEACFGVDFSTITFHTGPKADEACQQVQALAFTYRNRIFFAEGSYQPESKEGQKLIAHELAHTIQQGAASRKPQKNEKDGGPDVQAFQAELEPLSLPDQQKALQMFRDPNKPEVDELVKLKDHSHKLRRCTGCTRTPEEGQSESETDSSSTFIKGQTLGVNTGNQQGWIRGYVGSQIRSLPDFLKVKYIERREGFGSMRDFFEILEGPYAGQIGALALGYLESKTWGGPVDIVFDENTGKVDYGAGQADATMQRNPRTNDPLLSLGQSYNLKLPDHPHSDSYGAYSGVWFRVNGGPQGDEYFHAGSVSWGCISVTETSKWPEIYDHVINKRRDNQHVGTVKRINS